MTNESTTTTPTPAAKPATNLVVGEIRPGKVIKALEYGVLVAIEGGPICLLHEGALTGGTHANRKARRASLEGKIKARQPEEVAVQVTSIRPPKEGDKSGRDRINVSERAIQESDILSQLKACTETEAGSIVVGVVKELRPYGALIECTEGPAKGYSMMLHASEVPGDRAQRDAFIASLTVGTPVEAEVLRIEDPADEKFDLRIGLTLVAATRREMSEALGDTDRVYRGKAGKGDKGGIRVEFGNMDNPMVGILPSAEMPAATKFGDTVRVRIARTEGDTIILTRKGIK